MPVHPVKGRPGCYQWGDSGKVYCGDGAKEKAEAQQRAAYANGYRGKAEEDKKNFTTIEDIEVGDVFKFGDGWERFVLKSKEIDGYEFDDEDGEIILYKIVFDPYKPSPVSDINGLVKSNVKMVRWNNPYLRMAKRRAGIKEAEQLGLDEFRDGLYNLFIKGKITEEQFIAWGNDYEAYLEGDKTEKPPFAAEENKKPYSVEISRSSNPEKKLMAVFSDKEGNKIKTTHFGQRGASDYTKHGDKERMERYLERHGGGTTTSTKEDWKDPTTAGALSRWILWNKPSLSGSFNDFKRRFGLKGSMKVSKSAEGFETDKQFNFVLFTPKRARQMPTHIIHKNPAEIAKKTMCGIYIKGKNADFNVGWPKNLPLYPENKSGGCKKCYEKVEEINRLEIFEANERIKERYFEKQMEKYKDKWDWVELSQNPSLTPALIEKYEDKWNWGYLSQNPSLTPALIEKYKDKLNWASLSRNPSLTPALIENYEDKWDWKWLSFNPSLTPSLIEKYKDKVDWFWLAKNPALTPAFIEKYENKLYWGNLSQNPALFGNLHNFDAEAKLSSAQKSLNKWTKEDWGTKSGKPSTQGKDATGERYLPRKAREALTDKEYARTSAKKRRDTAKGKQFSPQPDDVEEKVKKYRTEQPLPNRDIVMNFYEEMLYDEDSDLFKIHQELNPPNQKPYSIYRPMIPAYDLYVYSFWKDEVPKNNRNGTPKNAKELVSSANRLQRENPKKLPIEDLSRFIWSLSDASQKYRIQGSLKERFNEVKTPWLSYKNKIYYWDDTDTISSLKNDFVKEKFLSLPTKQKMAILHNNWERYRDYRFSKEELEELTAGAIFKEMRLKGFDFYVPRNDRSNKDKMIEIYEKRMEKYAEQVFEAIEGKGSKARFTDQPDPKIYRDPALRQKARNSLLKGTKGGDAGEWSARKAQMAATKYRTMYENKYGEGKNPYF